MQKIVLMGNPNVGKSLIFSRLTGTKVVTSNFPGTTVGITKGTLCCTCQKCTKHNFTLIDAPGIYSLTTRSQDIEKVAVAIVEQAEIIINVIDATNLERNLLLTLELLKNQTTPFVIALNLWDEAEYHGINIDVEKLSALLQVPIIPTVGVHGKGIKKLFDTIITLSEKPMPRTPFSEPISWESINTIVQKVQTKIDRKKHIFEYIETITVDPFWGTLCALFILLSSFSAIFFLSDWIESGISALLSITYTPLLIKLHQLLNSSPFLQQMLVGNITGNEINYAEAMGILSSGIYIPLAKVAPAVAIFYGIIGILEDTGYLPRLAILSDTLMHRFALHGFAIVPMILGAGCNVTGIIATRILPNKMQRMITSFLLSVSVPCTSQIAMIVKMGSRMGATYMLWILGILFSIWYGVGRFLGAHQKKSYSELILEIPPYRLPQWKLVLKKLQYRMYNFLEDAIPVTIGGIFILLFCNYFHFFDKLAHFLSIFSEKIWGLPASVIPVILMGLFRKEIALSFLDRHSELTSIQLCVTTLILSISFACLSVYAILYKEFGGKALLYMILGMCLISTIAGFTLSSVLTLLATLS